MSGTAIISALLCASPTVLAAVPEGNIWSGGLPEGTATPSLLSTSISDVDSHGLTGGARLTTERVQVTIRTATHRERAALIALVKLACDGASGAIAGSAVLDVVSAGKGPDFQDDASVWLTSVDFRVTFRP